MAMGRDSDESSGGNNSFEWPSLLLIHSRTPASNLHERSSLTILGSPPDYQLPSSSFPKRLIMFFCISAVLALLIAAVHGSLNATSQLSNRDDPRISSEWSTDEILQIQAAFTDAGSLAVAAYKAMSELPYCLLSLIPFQFWRALSHGALVFPGVRCQRCLL